MRWFQSSFSREKVDDGILLDLVCVALAIQNVSQTTFHRPRYNAYLSRWEGVWMEFFSRQILIGDVRCHYLNWWWLPFNDKHLCVRNIAMVLFSGRTALTPVNVSLGFDSSDGNLLLYYLHSHEHRQCTH